MKNKTTIKRGQSHACAWAMPSASSFAKGKLLRFSLLSLLVMLWGNVFAAEPKVTLDFTDKTAWDIPTSGSANKDLASFTNGTYTIKLYATTNYKMNTGYLILGKADSYLELPAFDFAVEKIEITGAGSASESVKQNIYVGETAVSTETTGAKDVTNTYEIASDYQAAGNIYKLMVKSSHNTQITTIKIYEKAATDPTKQDVTLSFDQNAYTATLGEGFTAPVLTNTNNVAVTYSSSNEAVATVDAESGAVTLVAAGTTTIKAEFAGNDTYNAASAQYTLTVTVAPYTSIAAMLADITSTKTNVTYQFTDLLVTYVNKSNTYVSDGANGFLFYGSNLGLAAGDKISGIATGQLYTYNGLPELAVSASGLEVEKASTGNAIDFTAITPADLQNYINKPAIIKNATYVSAGSGKNLNFKVGETDLVVYNNWDADISALEADKTYDLKGIGAVYAKNDATTYQLYLDSFTEATTEEPGDEPTSETIFSAKVIATSNQGFSTGITEITADQATIEGGKMYAVSAQESDKNMIAKQGSVYYFALTNNNTYFKVELDKALAVGDVITADALGGIKSDAEKGLWVSTTDGYPSVAPACAATSATESIIEGLLNYTVTAGSEYVGKTTLYIYRAAGATEYFNNFVITRTSGSDTPGDDPTPSTTFRDIKLNLMEHSELLTGSDVNITVAEDGTIGTTENAAEAAATIKGSAHGSYGSSNFTASVPVQGCVKITYATHDYGNDITVTNTEGAEVAKFNTNGAKWMSNHDNVVVAYYRDNTPTTLNFSKANYNPYFAVEAIDEADLPAEVTKYNVTFTAGDAQGVAPAVQEVEAGAKIKLPKNYTLYKEGYTLTGWNDGTETKAPGTEVTISAETTFVPIFTANEASLAERNAAVTISYALDGYNDNPKHNFQSGDGIIVTQATVNGKSIDVAVTTNGKFAHNGSGWHQLNAGTKVTVPSAKGATFSVKTYEDANALKFGDTAAEAGATATYTATAEDATLVIEQTAQGYWNNLTITLPKIDNGDDPGEEPQPHERYVLKWDYTEAAPTDNPDNGLYYASKVDDGEKNANMGLNGIKMNSGGYAYFEKEAGIAGKLYLTFGNRKNASEYKLNVSRGTLGADNKPVKGELIAETPAVTDAATVNVEIPADVTGIYIDRSTAAEGVLQKIEFKENIVRNFTDFEIPYETLKADGYTGADLPAGVTFSGSFHDGQHGYSNATLVVPVDGTVKFTISGCQYGGSFPVKNSEGETLATLNQKEVGCYDAGGILTYFYTGAATTLTFGPIQYLSYFKAEATEVEEVTITYKNQNDEVLGTKKVYEGEAIGEVPYTESDLTIDEGYKFRGWVYTSGVKVKATDTVNGNVTVKASVTAIETTPEVGTVQTYDLTKATFYPEDHENFNVTDGAYYNNHGFTFNAGGSFDVAVGGKAQVVLALCQYGNGTTITVTDAAGNTIKSDVPAKAEADGGTTAINYDGEATTLTFTFAAQTYLHSVTVYNVSDFVEKDEATGYYIVPAGDGAGFVLALNAASSEENAKIFLPNGTYDLGESTLTPVSGKNVSIIGESMEGVIIMNAPDKSIEGLGSADLLVNTGEGLYMQDLTLKNAMAFDGSTGRAVTLHDKGTKTINKNVRHLSYQDTYYSHKVGGVYYFDGGEIHGVVDYMCGNGKVYFNEVKLVNEEIKATTMTANSELYVFNNCEIETLSPTFNLGRAWSDNPVCIFLNTTINQPEKLIESRWNLTGINCDYSKAGEYGTKDAKGNDITPTSNKVTFLKANTELETILTADEAATYTISYVLGDWAAEAQAQTAQLTAPEAELGEDGTITWDAVEGATAYEIEGDGKHLAILAGDVTSVTMDALLADDAEPAAAKANAEEADNEASVQLTIRAANARGGFGEAKVVKGTEKTAIATVNAERSNVTKIEYFNLQGQRVSRNHQGVAIRLQTLANGQTVAEKVILK